ncbi:MAG: thioredoxin domain-containing protein [Nitrospirota bacterium]|nr:thioredoxin domain-containing protein [Nitrospirota bacterium]
MSETTSQSSPSNRLAHETSPYLRQHGHNPVDWYPWGEEALARAKAENKPILLSIGYSACHWCHVMAHESFENPEIAKLMNEHFVNIKVDREERPDLDDIYQKSVQVFMGRGGGWPLTVFLTPDQEPFYGGTYFPPVPRYNMPSFPQVLLGVVEAYHQHGAEVQQNVQRVKAGLQRVNSARPSAEPLTYELFDGAATDLCMLYEPVHGGFGDGPKFPTVPPLSLLLRQWYRVRDQSAREEVEHSLRKMAAGGIYDHLGGGFHRYSVDGQWLVPHFEKMLYDNAQLVRIYLDGWRLTREVRFRRVVEETLDYISREMCHPDGGFFAAQDADSEGHEGKFFLWEPAEIKAVLGPELGETFCRFYDVTEAGNFEGKNILNRLCSAKLPAEEQEQMERLLTLARRQLLEVRERRVKPGRDDKILTSWNGLMISGLLDAYQAFGTPAYLALAEGALAFLLEHAYQQGRLTRTVSNGQGRLNGYLDDYAFLAAALLDAFEATSRRVYLDKACELTGVMLEQFWDPQVGGCFFTGKDHETLIHRMKSGMDSAIPSGNAVAAMNYLRLFFFTGEQNYMDRAEQTLGVFRAQMDHNAYGSAAMLCALDFYLAKPKEIVLLGARTDPAMQALVENIHGRYVPNKTLVLVDPTGAADAATIPAAAKGKAVLDGKPTAYICHKFTCSHPITDWAALEELL